MPTPGPIPATQPSPPLGNTALRNVALVAGCFLLLLGALMLLSHVTGSVYDPLTAPTLQSARQQLQLAPTNATLQAELRRLDLQLRREFFLGLRRRQLGAWFLFIGAIIFLLAARTWTTRHQALPDPLSSGSLHPEPIRLAILARRTSIVLVVLVLLLGLALIALVPAPPLDRRLQQLARGPGAPDQNPAVGPKPGTTGPSQEQLRDQWPRFRGPDGSGIAHTHTAPTNWNGDSGEGIAWKTPLATREFNSPIVWEPFVFVSSGDLKERAIEAYDADTGKPAWRASINKLPPDAAAELEIPELSRLSAPTVATDGERVFGIFATGELLAVDFSGRTLWTKYYGKLKNPYGHATSLVIWRDRLLVQIDQAEAEDARSRLCALDVRSGNVVWQARRTVPSSWATPLVLESPARSQLITLGEPWVIGYDLATGTELWRLECLGTDLAPSPIPAGDRVIIVSPWKHLSALRTDGSGDVTRSHQLWSNTEQAPDITSPLTDGRWVYTLQTEGAFAAIDLETGAVAWTHQFKGPFHASPALAAGRIYLFNVHGLCYQLAPGPTFVDLGTAPLGDEVFASPAFVAGRLYVRGAKHLWCIGTREAPTRKLSYAR